MTFTATTATPATIVLRPRDPLVVRDARPFTAEPGARATTLDWPLPQTLAGAVRSHIGELAGFNWQTDGPEKALAISVTGGFPIKVDGQTRRTYLPAPRDAVPYEEDGHDHLLCLRPQAPADGEGCDLPAGAGLWPLAVAKDVKVTGGHQFWSTEDVVHWLAVREHHEPPRHGLAALPRDTRVHVSVDPERGTARDGALFS